MTQALMRAAACGLELFFFYVELDSPDRYIARANARLVRGGHPIAPAKIRARYPKRLANLIKLLACAKERRIYDNSDESTDGTPRVRLVPSMSKQRIIKPSIDGLLATAPDWARPVAAAPIQAHERPRTSKARK
jgi:predicted ABC-type ATPase